MTKIQCECGRRWQPLKVRKETESGGSAVYELSWLRRAIVRCQLRWPQSPQCASASIEESSVGLAGRRRIAETLWPERSPVKLSRSLGCVSISLYTTLPKWLWIYVFGHVPN